MKLILKLQPTRTGKNRTERLYYEDMLIASRKMVPNTGKGRVGSPPWWRPEEKEFSGAKEVEKVLSRFKPSDFEKSLGLFDKTKITPKFLEAALLRASLFLGGGNAGDNKQKQAPMELHLYVSMSGKATLRYEKLYLIKEGNEKTLLAEKTVGGNTMSKQYARQEYSPKKYLGEKQCREALGRFQPIDFVYGMRMESVVGEKNAITTADILKGEVFLREFECKKEQQRIKQETLYRLHQEKKLWHKRIPFRLRQGLGVLTATRPTIRKLARYVDTGSSRWAEFEGMYKSVLNKTEISAEVVNRLVNLYKECLLKEDSNGR